jgi:hypothetical protein
MAIDGLPNVRTRAIQRALVSAIREQRPGFTVGTTGRVFDGITGMKRELRQYVRLDGDPIRGVDIRSAQPALLAELLRGTKQAADIKYPSTELKGVSTCSMYLLLSVSFFFFTATGGSMPPYMAIPVLRATSSVGTPTRV